MDLQTEKKHQNCQEIQILHFTIVENEI